jgi:hypothetical protein
LVGPNFDVKVVYLQGEAHQTLHVNILESWFLPDFDLLLNRNPLLQLVSKGVDLFCLQFVTVLIRARA